jgi:penicillin-binding protein 2
VERKDLIVLFAAAVTALGLLEARLFWLQVLHADRYRAEISRPRHLEVVPAVRGRILDRTGTVLADNRRSFDLYVVLEEFEADAGAVERLAARTGIPAAAIRGRIERIYRAIQMLQKQRPAGEHAAILRRERRTPYLLLRDIRFEAAYEIEVHGHRYPGLSVRETVRRVYPNGPLAAVVIGYVGKVPDEEHKRWRDDPEAFRALREAIGDDGVELLWRRGAFEDFLIGRAGLEHGLEQRLSGRPGVRLVSGRGAGAVRLALVEPQAGEDVRLTLDARIQAAAERALEGRRGAVVVLDVRDGAVLAMASSPGFDPNAFVPPARAADVASYFAPDSGAPLVNRALCGRYPPGSTFKIVTALAALGSRAVRAEERILCNGRYSERWGHLRCWIHARNGGWHGELTLAEALERSCNVYFNHAAVRTGAAEITAWAYRCGLGRPSGLPLPQDVPGEIPMYAHMNEVETASYGMGQGPVTATPLQIAGVVASVARGGRGVRPRILADAPVEEEDWQVAPDDLAAIREGLRRVVHGENGTARDPILRAVRMAGKTGTAQVGGDLEPHAWFAGYFPHDAPRFAIAVLIEHGGSGGHEAAPVAGEIARECLRVIAGGE